MLTLDILPESGYAGNGMYCPDPTPTYDRVPVIPVGDGDLEQFFNLRVGVDTTYQFPQPSSLSNDLRSRFVKFVTQWKKETAHLSIVSRQASTMSFLHIVSLGEEAVPWIFEEFERSPSASWPIVLEAITFENPAINATSYREAVKQWLDWGKANGYR